MVIKELRYWVQKVLPLVYDDSLSYYELLAKVVSKVNELVGETNALNATIERDVEEIMNAWLEDGTFEELINQTVLGDLNDRITQSESDIDNLQDDVSALETEMYFRNNRRYVVISDSYGKGRNNTTPWTTFLKGYLGASDTDYFTYSEGSMGFNLRGEDNHNAQELLQANLNNISNHSTITDVVVGMGANDTLATLGLETAIVNFITYALSVFPNAKVHIGFIGNKIAKNSTELENFMSAMTQYTSACEVTPASEIAGVSSVMHNASLMHADGVHPTTDGSREIAKFVNAYLHGESPIYKAFGNCNISSTYFTGASAIQCIEGNTASIHLNLGTTNSGGIPFSDRQFYAVGTITGAIIRGIEACPFEFRIRTFTVDTTNPVDLLVQIKNGTVYVSRGSVHSSEDVAGSAATYTDACTLATDMC